MRHPVRMVLTLAGTIAAVVVLLGASNEPNSQPNPYRTLEAWGKLPQGRTWGSTAAVDIDSHDHVWIAERCGANSCAGSSLDPILEFDPEGNLLKSFGSGMFVFPHGICVDKNGNVWVTDGQGKDGKGHQVFKFSPEGKVLMIASGTGFAGDTSGYFQHAIRRNRCSER